MLDNTKQPNISVEVREGIKKYLTMMVSSLLLFYIIVEAVVHAIRQEEKYKENLKRRNKTPFIYRPHGHLCRISIGFGKKSTRTNKWFLIMQNIRGISHCFSIYNIYSEKSTNTNSKNYEVTRDK